jgi:hypothetical protein
MDIPNFDGNGINIKIALAQQCLRVFCAEVLEIRKRRFAKHCSTPALQGARTGRNRLSSQSQRESFS